MGTSLTIKPILSSNPIDHQAHWWLSLLTLVLLLQLLSLLACLVVDDDDDDDDVWDDATEGWKGLKVWGSNGKWCIIFT